MINITNKSDCCGCNACGDVCPKGAISFEKDEEGFLYPKVDAAKCVNCGLCDKVCPQLNVTAVKKNEYAQPKSLAAVHKNYMIRFDSTSGGAFSALAKYIYGKGGFVGGAVWTDDFEIRQVVTDKQSELPRLRSSKYAQSDARGFYAAVKSALETCKPVLVCGTPCQMAALRLFVGEKLSQNLFVLDFICRGNNSPLLMRRYIDHFEKKHGSKLIAIKFKNKELGWRNLTKKMTFADGSVEWDVKDGSLFSACYHKCHVFCRPSCYDCKYKGLPFVGDITLGDAWLKNRILKPEMDRDLGTSLILLNNSKGEELFNAISGKMLLQDLKWDDVLDGNRMFDKSIPMPDFDRAEFFRMLDNDGIAAVVKHCDEIIAARAAARPKESPIRKLRHLVGCVIRKLRWLKQNRKMLPSLVCCNGWKAVLKGRNLLWMYKRSQLLNQGGTLKLGAGDVRFGNGSLANPPFDSYILIRRGGKLNFGGYTHFTYGANVEVHDNAELTIGSDCGFNVGCTIICADKITLGKGVKGGRNVTIRDNNGGHWMNFSGYRNSRPVEIGDHVWLCEGCTIMPGVKIGAGAVIGAKSVVFNNVPANTMVMGNPAQVVCENVEWKY